MTNNIRTTMAFDALAFSTTGAPPADGSGVV
jgi:hypothetical protein